MKELKVSLHKWSEETHLKELHQQLLAKLKWGDQLMSKNKRKSSFNQVDNLARNPLAKKASKPLCWI